MSDVRVAGLRLGLDGAPVIATADVLLGGALTIRNARLLRVGDRQVLALPTDGYMEVVALSERLRVVVRNALVAAVDVATGSDALAPGHQVVVPPKAPDVVASIRRCRDDWTERGGCGRHPHALRCLNAAFETAAPVEVAP